MPSSTCQSLDQRKALGREYEAIFVGLQTIEELGFSTCQYLMYFN